MKEEIAVIGGGVVGLSVARALARRGAKVTLLEARQVGGGTSKTTYAWINSNGKSPHSYHLLNVEGMNEHRRLQAQCRSQAVWLDESGTIEWALSEPKKIRLKRRVEALVAKGYPAHKLNHGEVSALIPELILPEESTEIWCFPCESVLSPTMFLAFLRTEALRCGVSIIEHQAVASLTELEAGVRLLLSDGSEWHGDFAVSAAGRWTQQLLAKCGVKIAMIDADKPGRIGCSFLGYTSAAPIQLRSNLITPEINIRPDGGGRLMLQVPDIDHLADP